MSHRDYLSVIEASDLLFVAADLVYESVKRLKEVDRFNPGEVDDLHFLVEPTYHLLKAQGHIVVDRAFDVGKPEEDRSTEYIKRGCRIIEKGHEWSHSKMYTLFTAAELSADDIEELRESESAYMNKIWEIADRRAGA